MKYSELLNKPYKKEMLSNISKDLKKYYPTMKEKEVELLTNEIYGACISIYYRVNLEKVVQLLCSLDNSYYIANEEKQDGMIESAITADTSEHLKTILDKYIGEIKKRECN